MEMWPRNGPAERSPLRGELLPIVPACCGPEPVGAVASGDRRAAAGSRRRGTRGGAGRRGAQALSERPSSRGPAGKRATGDVAVVAHQGGGVGDRELSPDRSAVER